MPTQRQGYYTADRKRVPSVTTITGRFKESGTLVGWAYRQGQEHERLRWQGEPAPSSLYDVSGKAADIGTAVHAVAESYVISSSEGWMPEDSSEVLSRFQLDEEQMAKALRSVAAFQQWVELTRIAFVYAEVPMVSEQLRVGGTLDWIGRLPSGELVLGDWKTSNAIYADHLVQVAGYRLLWQETHPTEGLAPGAHILRFSKEEGDFAHHHFANLDQEERQFRLWRESYELDQKISRRV